MQRLLLKSLLINAQVTALDEHRVAGVAIDSHLLDSADIVEYEQLELVNIQTGARLTSFALRAERNSGQVMLGSAYASFATLTDQITIASYLIVSNSEASHYWPRLLKLDNRNRVVE
ncbi:MAG: aspartate 1-decarboxylase [Acidobacteriota bacterium]